MPFEERYINFNLDEIQQAISIGCVKENIAPIPAEKTLTQIEINETDPEHQESIFIKVSGDNGEERVSYDRKFFALALVFYCQGSGIPIPARGKKVLNIKEDHIVMQITLERKAFDE